MNNDTLFDGRYMTVMVNGKAEKRLYAYERSTNIEEFGRYIPETKDNEVVHYMLGSSIPIILQRF